MKAAAAERYTRYLLTVRCNRCNESVFPDQEDASAFVEHMMGHSDEYDEFSSV
jgi:hypothetical protein